MQRRVYQYPSVQAYAFHMSRFMEEMYKGSDCFKSVESYVEMSEADVLCKLREAAKAGHLDACALQDRKKRFQAIELENDVKEGDLRAYQAKKAIPSQLIHWEMGKNLSTKRGPIILRKSRELVPADQFSGIIPPHIKKHWLYLAPEYVY